VIDRSNDMIDNLINPYITPFMHAQTLVDSMKVLSKPVIQSLSALSRVDWCVDIFSLKHLSVCSSEYDFRPRYYPEEEDTWFG
jgi:hypothetical protein